MNHTLATMRVRNEKLEVAFSIKLPYVLGMWSSLRWILPLALGLALACEKRPTKTKSMVVQPHNSGAEELWSEILKTQNLDFVGGAEPSELTVAWWFTITDTLSVWEAFRRDVHDDLGNRINAVKIVLGHHVGPKVFNDGEQHIGINADIWAREFGEPKRSNAERRHIIRTLNSEYADLILKNIKNPPAPIQRAVVRQFYLVDETLAHVDHRLRKKAKLLLSEQDTEGPKLVLQKALRLHEHRAKSKTAIMDYVAGRLSL